MADRIIKPDSGNDVVIQNNGGTRKIEVTNAGDVEVTGDFKATNLKATNLKANDGTASLEIADSTGDIGFSGNTNLKIKLPSAGGIYESDGSTQVLTESGGSVTIQNATFNGTIGSSARANSIQPESGQSLVLKDDDGNSAITIPNDAGGDVFIGSDLGAKFNVQQSTSGIWAGYIKNSASSGNGYGLKVETTLATSSDLSFGVIAGGTWRFQVLGNGNAVIQGALSKGSGSFKIDHPLESKSDTHHLVHSFIEGPQADLIYRGKVTLVDGEATVNLDTVSNMTEGTFVALNTNIQCFTSNETGWGPVKGSLSGNILTITAQDDTSTDTISWMVVGERHDPHMIETEWTDENGKVIVEPEKVEALENA